MAQSNSLEMPAFWALIPARRVNIRKLVVENVDPVVSAVGSVTLDPDVLQVRLEVASPLLAVPLDISGTINPDGRVAMTLTETGSAEPMGSLTGAPDADRQAMAFDGRIVLAGRPFVLAGAYVGVTQATGEAQIDIHARTPWPLPTQDAWRTIDGDGHYRVALVGATSALSGIETHISGTFALENGTIKARLDTGSVVLADVPEIAKLGKGADLAARVTLSNDADVDIVYDKGEVRIGDGLIASVNAANKPVRVRLRGAFAEDHHFELGVLGIDGAPIVLATGLAADARSVELKAQLALTGKVLNVGAALAGVAASGGHVVADFEGVAHLPSVPGAGLLQNVTGKGRARIALTGRFGAQQPFDLSLDGDYAIDDAVHVTVDSGAHVVLSGDAVELSTVSPLTLKFQPAQSSLAAESVDLKVALAPIAVGKHTLALNNVWVAVDRVSMTGGVVEGSAVIRTHAGRDALPIRVSLSHDLSSATGTFSLAGDWAVDKALLRTQLPGFDAPYDLDRGAVVISLNGRWDASKSFVYQASGHVRVDGRQAHYEDYAISGLLVDVPLQVDNEGYTVADTKVSVGSFDVGFPTTDISLGLAVANGVAQVRALSGSVLGGHFSAAEFGYDLATDRGSPTIELDGIALSDLLALEGGDVRGNGTLDGKLPISIDGDAFTVVGGRVVARAPGGTLMYKGAAASSMVAHSGMGFAFQALTDFRFTTLDANVALATDGVLTLGVRLQGANPAVEQGRAIQFNLNLTESIPALLESLRAAQDITDKVEGRFGR